MVEKYKIVHNRDECIGCNACAMVAPTYWVMGEDGKSNLKNAQKQDNKEVIEEITEGYDLNHEAAESCPVNCIHLFEKKDDGSEEKII